MVVCKFFLQGTCKFGSNCKFDHHLNDYGVSPLLNQASVNANTNNQTTSNVDLKALIKALVNDMTSAEKGGQWLFSSYAPFKDKPPFPGFEDHSMEEIRFLFYEARNNGTLEQYQQNLQAMLQQAMLRVKSLQNPSPDAINMLKTIYNTPSSNSANANQSIFSSQPQQQTSIFNNQPQQNIFGGSMLNNSASVFANAQNQNTSIFGNPMQVATQSTSIFGNPTQTATPAQPIGGNSIFGGGNQSVFATQQPPPINTVPTQSMFQTANNQFGRPQAVPQPNKQAFQHSQNIFGNILGQTAMTGVVGGPKPNPEFYSKREELSEDEIRWFESDDIDVSQIPEKPPTYEMCFPSR